MSRKFHLLCALLFSLLVLDILKKICTLLRSETRHLNQSMSTFMFQTYFHVCGGGVKDYVWMTGKILQAEGKFEITIQLFFISAI